MSKISFREQIDLEMKDVCLSAERVRRIHSLTDGRQPPVRRFSLPRRLPAALLAAALAACALFALISRAGSLFGPGGDAVVDPLSHGGASGTPAPQPTESPELSFEAAGVRFALESAEATADTLTLNWRVSSERDDQACVAFCDFGITGCECHANPEVFDGLAGLSALGGAVEGVPLPANRYYGTSIPISASGGVLTVRVTMAVYAPAAEPRLELSFPNGFPAPTPEPQSLNAAADSPLSETDETLEKLRGELERALAAGERERALSLQDEMRYIDCMDALEDGQLSFTEEGEISPAYPDTLEAIAFDRAYYDALPAARASLEMAAECGVIVPLGEAAIEFEIPVSPRPTAAP